MKKMELKTCFLCGSADKEIIQHGVRGGGTLMFLSVMTVD